MNLSPDQHQALIDITGFLTNKTTREFVLTGGPGMGKSFLTKQIIEKAKQLGYEIILGATTHPAAGVLANFANDEVHTVHKLLDLVVVEDYVNNTTSIKQQVPNKGPMISQLSWGMSDILIIMDEASYIDEELKGYIDSMLNNFGCVYILYVGDKDQLPPVGSEEPYIFHCGLPTCYLTTDHRFKDDSQMADIVRILKNNITDKSYFLTGINTGKEITVLDFDDFLDKTNELYTSDEYQQNPYYVKSVAYRNTVVDNTNSYIRRLFFSDPEYQINERLLVNKPLVRNRKMLAKNGDILTVLSNTQTDINGVKGQWIKFSNPQGNIFSAMVTTDYRKKSIEKKKFIKAADWKGLYNFMESFIEVKDIYASTIHKAQGASYKNIMLNLEDLVECTDSTLLARLLLVAVSRASEHVYVYGEVPENLLRK